MRTINYDEEKKMAQPALAIANFFLEKADEENLRSSMTPMKLLKLVYYAHAWYVTIRDKPLLREPVEAWKHGPVVPKVYHEFSRFRGSPVMDFGREDNGNAIAFHDESWESEDDEILNAVWDKYKKFNGTQLSNLSHRENEPWFVIQKEKNIDFDVDRGIKIPESKIKECFTRIVSEK